MADDGSGNDITIPSMLLFKRDADAVKSTLKTNTPIEIEMKWAVPTTTSDDGVVEYVLFSTPTDIVSKSFRDEFEDIAVQLGPQARFKPHSYIYDGVKSHCVGAVGGENMCYNLCSNHGRYCAIDPDNNLDVGVSGADVVRESLRRLCIWKVYGEEDGIGVEWWDYVREWQSHCSASADSFSSDDCIAAAYNHSFVDGALVDKCMQDAGGLEGDNSNSLLDEQIAAQSKLGVVVLPTAFVNTAVLRGQLSASNVLTAVCGGYEEQAPHICATCVDQRPACFRGDMLACVSAGGNCSAMPPTLAPTEESSSTTDGSDESNIPSNFLQEMVVGLIEEVGGEFGDMEMPCGLDLNQLEETLTQSTGDEAEPEGLLFQRNPFCTPLEETQLKNATQTFHTCSGWDIKEIIETLPSAVIGTLIRCSNAVGGSGANTSNDDEVLLEECAEVVLGDNPLGSAFKSFLLYPDKNCPCLQSLSESVPECELDLWPVPVVGSWLKTGTCLTAGLGCRFVEKLCISELQALEQCLPPLPEKANCEELTMQCPDAMIPSLPPSLSSMPLPDACVRLYNEQNETTFSGSSNLLERFDAFLDECGKNPDFWDMDSRTSLMVSKSNKNADSDTTAVVVGSTLASEHSTEPDHGSDTAGRSSSSYSGFFVGLMTGVCMTAVFGGAIVYHFKKKKQSSSVRKYEAIEMT